MTADRRSNTTLAALAAPCLPLAGLGLPLVVYLPEFYASELGLSLASVGAAFMAVRLLDMAFDPFIGSVMDRTRSRFGRFKPWFALSAPILMLASYMLFMAKPGVTNVYLWFWLVVVYAGFSIASLSQLAWAAVLSADYDQRSRIYAWWQSGNVIGMIFVLTLPAMLPLVGIKGHAEGVAAMGWFIIALMPITVGLALWKAPEPRITTAARHAGIKEYVALIKRPSVVRILAADLLIGTGPAITGALFFFFFERVKGFGKAEASALLLIYFLGGLVGAPLWTWLSYRIGKHRALAVSGLIYTAMTLAVLLIPEGNFISAAVLMALIGIPYAAGAFLLRSMMADIGDEERLESGVDRTGLLYALLAGTVKIGSAVAVGATFPALQALGFNAAVKGGESGLVALSFLFTAVPAGMALAAAWIVLGFPITAARHAEIRDALAARDLIEAAPEMSSDPLIAEEIHAPPVHAPH